MKKGFTLIELLAVIIILAIVALIATPIVLDVVDDARTSAAKSEAAMIVSGINNYCATAEMKAQLNNTTSECEEGVSVASVPKMVDLGNAKVLELTYDKKLTYLKVESNGKTVEYDGSTYKIDGETAETPGGSSGSTSAAYSIGDKVTLTDGTTWIVIEDSTISDSKLKLVSMQNILPNLSSETGTSMFSNEPATYKMPYDDDSNVWEDSTLKAYLDGTVKTRLEASLNTTISDITIWGLEELAALGCTFTGSENEGYDFERCNIEEDMFETIGSILFSGNSWTNIPATIANVYHNHLWHFESDGNVGSGHVTNPHNLKIGARPIITVSKSVIKQ